MEVNVEVSSSGSALCRARLLLHSQARPLIYSLWQKASTLKTVGQNGSYIGMIPRVGAALSLTKTFVKFANTEKRIEHTNNFGPSFFVHVVRGLFYILSGPSKS
jgi:hypothetical protein